MTDGDNELEKVEKISKKNMNRMMRNMDRKKNYQSHIKNFVDGAGKDHYKRNKFNGMSPEELMDLEDRGEL